MANGDDNNNYMTPEQMDNYLKSMGEYDNQESTQNEIISEMGDYDRYLRNLGQTTSAGTPYTTSTGMVSQDIPWGEYERLGIDYRIGSETIQDDLWKKQSAMEKFGNAATKTVLNTFYDTIGGVAATFDFRDYFNADDQIGNDITRWAERQKKEVSEKRPIYQRENAGMGDFAWWMENGSGLVSSIAAFGIQGALLGGVLGVGTKAVRGLANLSKIGKTKAVMRGLDDTLKQGKKIADANARTIDRLNTAGVMDATKAVGSFGTRVAHAAGLNQAESIMSATQVYDDAYKRAIEQGYSDAYARRLAATAGSNTINLNRMNVALNLTMANKFLKGSNDITSLVKRRNWKNQLGDALFEGGQESVEEAVNLMAEKQSRILVDELLEKPIAESTSLKAGDLLGQTEQDRKTVGDVKAGGISMKDTYQGLDITNPFGDAKTKEITETLFLGALGGLGQTGLIKTFDAYAKMPTISVGGVTLFDSTLDARYTQNQYYADGSLKARKGDIIYDTEDATYDEDVYYNEGEIATEDITTEDGTVIKAGDSITEDDKVIKHKKGDVQYKRSLTDPTKKEAVQKIKKDKNGKAKTLKVGQVDEATGKKTGGKATKFTRNQLHNKKIDRLENDLKPLLDQAEKFSRLMGGAKYQNHVEGTIKSIEDYIEQGRGMDEDKRNLMYENIATLDLLHDGNTEITPEQLNEKIKELKEKKFSEKDLREKQNELLDMSLAQTAVQSFELGYKKQLKRTFYNVLNMSEEEAIAAGYGVDYKEKATESINKIDEYYDRWREYNGKHSPRVARALFFNRLQRDMINDEIKNINDDMKQLHDEEYEKYTAKEGLNENDFELKTKYDQLFELEKERQKEIQNDKELKKLRKKRRDLNSQFEKLLIEISNKTKDTTEDTKEIEDLKDKLDALSKKMNDNETAITNKVETINNRFKTIIEGLGLPSSDTAVGKQGEYNTQKISKIDKAIELDNEFDKLRNKDGEAEVDRKDLERRRKMAENELFLSYMYAILELQERGGGAVYNFSDDSFEYGQRMIGNVKLIQEGDQFFFEIEPEEAFITENTEENKQLYRQVIRPDMLENYNNALENLNKLEEQTKQKKEAKQKEIDEVKKTSADFPMLKKKKKKDGTLESDEEVRKRSIEQHAKNTKKKLDKLEKEMLALDNKLNAAKKNLENKIRTEYAYYQYEESEDGLQLYVKPAGFLTSNSVDSNFVHIKEGDTFIKANGSNKKLKAGDKVYYLNEDADGRIKDTETGKFNTKAKVKTVVRDFDPNKNNKVLLSEDPAPRFKVDITSLDKTAMFNPEAMALFRARKKAQKVVNERIALINIKNKKINEEGEEFNEVREELLKENDEVLTELEAYNKALTALKTGGDLTDLDIPEVAELKMLQLRFLNAGSETLKTEISELEKTIDDFENEVDYIKRRMASISEYLDKQYDKLDRIQSGDEKFTSNEAREKEVKEIHKTINLITTNDYLLKNRLDELLKSSANINNAKNKLERLKQTLEGIGSSTFAADFSRIYGDFNAIQKKKDELQLLIEQNESTVEVLEKLMDYYSGSDKSFRGQHFKSRKHLSNFIDLFDKIINQKKELIQELNNTGVDSNKDKAAELSAEVKSLKRKGGIFDILPSLESPSTDSQIYNELSRLKEEGIITNEQFNELKNEWLNYTVIESLIESMKLGKKGTKEFIDTAILIEETLNDFKNNNKLLQKKIDDLGVIQEDRLRRLTKSTLGLMSPEIALKIFNEVEMQGLSAEEYNNVLEKSKEKLSEKLDKVEKNKKDIQGRINAYNQLFNELIEDRNILNDLADEIEELIGIINEDDLDNLNSISKEFSREGQKELLEILEEEIKAISTELALNDTLTKIPTDSLIAFSLKSFPAGDASFSEFIKNVEELGEIREQLRLQIKGINLLYNKFADLTPEEVLRQEEIKAEKEIQEAKDLEDIQSKILKESETIDEEYEDESTVKEIEKFENRKSNPFTTAGKQLQYDKGSRVFDKNGIPLFTNNSADLNWFNYLNTISDTKQFKKDHVLKIMRAKESGFKFYDESGNEYTFDDKDKGLIVVLVNKNTGEYVKNDKGEALYAAFANENTIDRLNIHAVFNYFYNADAKIISNNKTINGKTFKQAGIDNVFDARKKGVTEIEINGKKFKFNINEKSKDYQNLRKYAIAGYQKQMKKFREDLYDRLTPENIDLYVGIAGLSEGDLLREKKDSEGNRQMSFEAPKEFIKSDLFDGFYFTTAGGYFNRGLGRGNKPGIPYIKLTNGTRIDTYPAKLKDNDALLVVKLISEWARAGAKGKYKDENGNEHSLFNNGGGKSELGLGLINKLINWNRTKKGENPRPLDMGFIIENGIRYIYYYTRNKKGNARKNKIKLSAIHNRADGKPLSKEDNAAIDRFTKFLTENKVKNVSKKLLDARKGSYDYNTYVHPTLQYGKIKLIEYKASDGRSAYENYLLSNDVLQTDVLPPSKTLMANKPQDNPRVGRYITFSNKVTDDINNTTTSITGPDKEDTPPPPPEDLDDEIDEDDEVLDTIEVDTSGLIDDGGIMDLYSPKLEGMSIVTRLQKIGDDDISTLLVHVQQSNTLYVEYYVNGKRLENEIPSQLGKSEKDLDELNKKLFKTYTGATKDPASLQRRDGGILEGLKKANQGNDAFVNALKNIENITKGNLETPSIKNEKINDKTETILQDLFYIKAFKRGDGITKEQNINQFKALDIVQESKWFPLLDLFSAKDVKLNFGFIDALGKRFKNNVQISLTHSLNNPEMVVPTTIHELTHVYTKEFIVNNPNDSKVQRLRKIRNAALEHIIDNPDVLDEIRGGELKGSDLDKAFYMLFGSDIDETKLKEGETKASFFRKLIEESKDVHELVKKANKASIDGDKNSLKEFVSFVMSDSNFQEFLNEIDSVKDTEKESLFDAIVKLIQDILSDVLGVDFDVKENSLLKEAIVVTSELIGDNGFSQKKLKNLQSKYGLTKDEDENLEQITLDIKTIMFSSLKNKDEILRKLNLLNINKIKGETIIATIKKDGFVRYESVDKNGNKTIIVENSKDVDLDLLRTPDLFDPKTVIKTLRTEIKDGEVLNVDENNQVIQKSNNITLGVYGREGKSQDSVGVNLEKGIFILSDGISNGSFSQTNGKVVSQFLVDFLLNNEISELLNDKGESNITIEALEKYVKDKDKFKKVLDFLNRKEFKDFLKDSSKPNYQKILNLAQSEGSYLVSFINWIMTGKDSSNKGYNGAGATLIYGKKINDNEYEIINYGDSLIYKVDANGKVVQEIQGNKDLSNSRIKFSFDSEKGTYVLNGLSPKKVTIKLEPGERIIFASDFIEGSRIDKKELLDNYKNDNFDLSTLGDKGQDDASFIAIEHDSVQPQDNTELDKKVNEIFDQLINRDKFKFVITTNKENELKNLIKDEIDELKLLDDLKIEEITISDFTEEMTNLYIKILNEPDFLPISNFEKTDLFKTTASNVRNNLESFLKSIEFLAEEVDNFTANDIKNVIFNFLSSSEYDKLIKEVKNTELFKTLSEEFNKNNYDTMVDTLVEMYKSYKDGDLDNEYVKKLFDIVNNFYNNEVKSGNLETYLKNNVVSKPTASKEDLLPVTDTKIKLENIELTQKESTELMEGMTSYLFEYFKNANIDELFDESTDVLDLYKIIRRKMSLKLKALNRKTKELLKTAKSNYKKKQYESTIESIDKILNGVFSASSPKNNWLKMVTRHADRMRSYGIKIDLDLQLDELDSSKDTAFNRNAGEVNHKIDMPPIVKLWVASRSVKRWTNGKYITQRNGLGFDLLHDFDELYNYIARRTANLPADAGVMYKELKKIYDKERKESPKASVLADFVGVNSIFNGRIPGDENLNMSLNELLLSQKVIQTFTKQTPEFYLITAMEDGSFKGYNANSKKTADKVFQTWKENYKLNLKDDPKDGKILKLGDAEIILNKIRSQDEELILKGLSELGIKIESMESIDEGLFSIKEGNLIEQLRAKNSISENLFNAIEKVKKYNVENPNNKKNGLTLKDYNPYEDKELTSLRLLADASAINSFEVLDNQLINADNKTVYGITLNHYMSLAFNEMNYHAGNETALRENLPHVFNVFNKGSRLKEYITDRRNPVYIKTALFNGFTYKTTGEVIKDMSEPNRWAMLLSSTLSDSPIYTFYRSADRTIENGFKLVDKNNSPVKLFNNHADVVSKSLDYLIDEMQTMYEIRKNNLGNNVKFYKEKAKNLRFFSGDSKYDSILYYNKHQKNQKDLLSEIEKIIENAVNTSDADISKLLKEAKVDGKPLTDLLVKSFKQYFERRAYGYYYEGSTKIKGSGKQGINESKSSVYAKLDELRLLTKIDESFFENKVYNEKTKKFQSEPRNGRYITGISSDIFNKYLNTIQVKNKEKLTDSELETILEQILLDFEAIQWGAYVEQSKILTGDPAMYKNEDDIFKRMKMFNSTKKVSIIDEALNTILNNRKGGKLYIEIETEKGPVREYLNIQLTDKELNDSVNAKSLTVNSDKVKQISNEISNNPNFKDFNISNVKIESDYGWRKDGKEYDNKINTAIFEDVIIESNLSKDNVFKINIEDGDITYLNENDEEVEPSHLRELFTNEFYNDGITNPAKLQAKVQSYLSPYNKYQEGDAQGYVTLDEYKEILLRSGDWSSKQQIAFDKIQRGEKLSINEVSLFPVLKTQYTGPLSLENSNTNDLSQGESVDSNNENNNLYIPSGYKHSLFPLIPDVVKGTNLENLLKMMEDNQIGIAQFISGNKYGVIVDENGNTNKFYSENGTIKYEVTDSVPMFNGKPLVTQTILYKYFGIQVDQEPKMKKNITVSSQFRKLILSNLIDAGIPVDSKEEVKKIIRSKINNFDSEPNNIQEMMIMNEWNRMTEEEKESISDIYKYVKEYTEIQSELIERPLNELITEVGINPIVEKDVFNNDIITGYQILNREKLIEVVIESSKDRNVPDNVLASINSLLDSDSHIEEVIGKEKVEQILNALINNRIIREKRKGEMSPQVCCSGFEQAATLSETGEIETIKGRSIKGLSGLVPKSLRTYRKGFDGKTLPAEIMISLPKEWNEWVNNSYENGLEDFNKELDKLFRKLEQKEEKNSQVYFNNDEKNLLNLITIIGFRIPNQALNSSDTLRIRRFLPTSAASAVVVPSEIVAKAGSDFDVDKLSLYIPYSIKPREINGKWVAPKYIPYLNSENSSDGARYIKYVFRNVPKSEIKAAEEDADIKELISELNNELDELKEKTGAEVNRKKEELKQAIKEAKEELERTEKIGVTLFNKIKYKSLKTPFYNLNKDLIDEGVTGIEKQIRFLEHVEILLAQFELDQGYALQYTNRDGKVIPENIYYDSEVRDSLVNLSNYYKEQIAEATGDLDIENSTYLKIIKDAADKLNEARKNKKSLDLTEMWSEYNNESKEAAYLTRYSIVEKIAENNNLIYFDSFKNLSLVKQNSKESLQNRMIELHNDIMSLSYNYRQLMAPISDAILIDDEIGVVGDIRFLNSESEELEFLLLMRNRAIDGYKQNPTTHIKGYISGGEIIETTNIPSNLSNGAIILNDETMEDFRDYMYSIYVTARDTWIEKYNKEMETKPLSQIALSTVNMQKFNYFLSGKAGVGQTAVHVTHHQLSAATNVFLNTEDSFWVFDHNKTLNKDGEIKPSFAGVKDVTGEWISETLSAFLTAYVDVAADPYVYDLNAGNSTANVILMLVRAGAPMGWIARFMAQPAIINYVKQQAANESIPNKLYGLELRKKELVDLVDNYSPTDGYIHQFMSEIDNINNDLFKEFLDAPENSPLREVKLNKLRNYAESDFAKEMLGFAKKKWGRINSLKNEGFFSEDKLFDYITFSKFKEEIDLIEDVKERESKIANVDESFGLGYLFNEYDVMQSDILDLFLEYQRQSTHFQELIRVTSPDSKGLGKSRDAVSNSLDTLFKVKALNMYGNIDSLIENTIVKEFDNTMRESYKLFKTLYLIEDIPVLKSTKTMLYNKFEPYQAGQIKKIRLYDIIVNDMLSAIISINTGDDSFSTRRIYEELFVSNKNLERTYQPKYTDKNGQPATLATIINELNSLTHSQILNGNKNSSAKKLIKFKNNNFIKELIANFGESQLSYDEFKNKSSIVMKKPKFDYIELINRKINTTKSNNLTESLQQIKEENSDFYYDLVKVGIMQSGFNLSPITFTNLIPNDDINLILKEKLKEFQNLPETRQEELMNKFMLQFEARNIKLNPLLKRAKGKYGYSVRAGTPISRFKYLNITKKKDGEVVKFSAKRADKVYTSKAGYDYYSYAKRFNYEHSDYRGMIVGEEHYFVGYDLYELDIEDDYSMKASAEKQKEIEKFNLDKTKKKINEKYTDKELAMMMNSGDPIFEGIQDMKVLSDERFDNIKRLANELSEKVEEEYQKETTKFVKPVIDLSREWKGDLKTRPVYTTEGINTMRTVVAKPNEHFGNPFSEAGYGDTIKVSSIAAAVSMYKDWLLNNAVSESQIVKGSVNDLAKFDKQRAWILDQINQGKLDGATLLYAGKLASRGQGMHPTALAEVVEQLRGQQQKITKPVKVVKPTVKNGKVNIYYSDSENVHLSNFAKRPFEATGIATGILYDLWSNFSENPLIFNTAEGGYQAGKLLFGDIESSPYFKNVTKKPGESYNAELSEEGFKLLNRLAEATGAEAKRIGRTIKMSSQDLENWDSFKEDWMTDIIFESFNQNPSAKASLLATGNMELTHTQDKGEWGKLFPEILMQVRDMFKQEQISSATEFDRGIIGDANSNSAEETDENNINCNDDIPF